MPKTLNCRDVGVDCDFQARGETTDDVLQQATEHAKAAHGFDSIPPELAEKVHAAIKDA